MKVNTFTSANMLLNRIEPILLQNEAANNLMIGLLFELKKQEEKGDSISNNYMYEIEDSSGRHLLAVLISSLKNAVIAGEYGAGAEQAIGLCVDRIYADGAPINGVVGPNELAAAFSAQWAAHNRQQPILTMKQRIYRLDRVERLEQGTGELRQAARSDLELAAEWICQFAEYTGSMAPYEKAIARAQEQIDSGTLYFWQNGRGEAVSMAKKTRPSANGVVVTNVYTPPRFRNQGYATACVAALCRKLLGEGYSFCSLYTDLSNPTSNGIYTKIGFQPVQDSYMFRFGEMG